MTISRTSVRFIQLIATAAAMAVSLPSAATAQSSLPQSRAFSVSGGVFHYDLSGVGMTPMVAFRADFPLGRALLAEGGFGVARPESGSGSRATLLTPEAQLQAQLPLGRVLPYIGLGGGAAVASQAGDIDSEVTASAAGGFRAWLTPRAGMRAELRVRGIGSGFEGAAAEWTVGFGWRF